MNWTKRIIPYAQKNNNDMYNGRDAIFMYFEKQSSK